jgi:hypothetical protein
MDDCSILGNNDFQISQIIVSTRGAYPSVQTLDPLPGALNRVIVMMKKLVLSLLLATAAPAVHAAPVPATTIAQTAPPRSITALPPSTA